MLVGPDVSKGRFVFILENFRVREEHTFTELEHLKIR